MSSLLTSVKLLQSKHVSIKFAFRQIAKTNTSNWQAKQTNEGIEQRQTNKDIVGKGY